MDNHQHHEELMESVAGEYKDILTGSKQAIYIYLDDTHKVCNGNFANLLGYGSAEEWGRIEGSFTDTFVAEESRESLVSAYQNSMENKIGSENKIVWKKKDGGKVHSSVILVPIVHNGHIFALHFISE